MNYTVKSALMFVLLFMSKMSLADEFEYLEEITSEKSLKWATSQTAKTKRSMERFEDFSKFNQEAFKLLTSGEKIISVSVKGQYVYHLLQSKNNIRGLWRRQLLTDYKQQRSNWEAVLDLDVLSKKEGKSWALKGASCLAPAYERCLLQLSNGGGDAVFLREFNTTQKQFTADGFNLAEGKHRLAWFDENTLLIAPGRPQDALTSSGYPREVYKWTLGTPFNSAELVYRGAHEDMMVLASKMSTPSQDLMRIRRMKTFYTFEDIVSDGETTVKLITPEDSSYLGEIGPYSVVTLKSDKGFFKQGSVVAYLSDDLLKGKENIRLIFEPKQSETVETVFLSDTGVYVQYLDDVKSRLSKVEIKGNDFKRQNIDLPKLGTLTVSAFDSDSETLFVKYSNFITPDSLYVVDGQSFDVELITRLKPDFDVDDLEVAQKFATSNDGTRVPYFIVHKKGLQLDNSNPTLLYGYGGFEVSYTARYSASLGKLWLDKGGVYVLANIRGGGEYGPRWHRAALKHKRHKAYEDFISVAETLISSGVTSKQKLAIRGGSNGGLLMGAMFTKRPDLFEAVICAVPLLDMLRFHKLLAGASWMGEYGNPDIEKDRNYLASYSPYHQIKENVKYPEILFTTSTKDDRVHPGHARKTAAKMLSMGHKVFFFENPEGGHAGASNPRDKAYQLALTYSYLWSKLL